MEDNAPLRVLQVLNHMDYGGIEAVVMNYYRYIDLNKLQFDFAVSEDSSLPQRDEIQRLGGLIYILPRLSNLTQYTVGLRDIIKENKYDIVHCHMNTLSMFPLFAAYLAGAKVRICHNHTTAHRGEGKKTVAKYLTRPFGKCFATDYLACGEYAGRWMYGNNLFDSGKVHVMRNAVDVEKFRYNPDNKIHIKKELGMEGKFVVGHVGRFTYTKNHVFLIDIFHEIYRKCKNAVLLLVGEGELEGQIKQKVKALGLEEAVNFYGICPDVNILYHVMDVFCLPSFYEGFPVVVIEAQMNGLPTVVSDMVTPEAKILEDYEAISLDRRPEFWADRILTKSKKEKKRTMEYLHVKEAGFAINEEAEKLLKYYFGKL